MCSNSENEEQNIVPDIVQLANEAGLEKVDEDDVQELLKSYDQNVSNEATSKTWTATQPD